MFDRVDSGQDGVTDALGAQGMRGNLASATVRLTGERGELVVGEFTVIDLFTLGSAIDTSGSRGLDDACSAGDLTTYGPDNGISPVGGDPQNDSWPPNMITVRPEAMTVGPSIAPRSIDLATEMATSQLLPRSRMVVIPAFRWDRAWAPARSTVSCSPSSATRAAGSAPPDQTRCTCASIKT